MPERPPAKGFSRREVLRLAAGSIVSIGALAGCRPSTRAGQSSTATETGTRTAQAGGETTSAAPAAADARRDSVVARAAANERALIAAYDDVLAHSPAAELAAKLRPLRDEHARHLDGLVPGASASLTPAPAPAASSALVAAPDSGGASSSRSLPASSPARADTLAHLAGLEQAAAAARLEDLTGTPPSLARLVASIGACEAAHNALLAVMM